VGNHANEVEQTPVPSTNPDDVDKTLVAEGVTSVAKYRWDGVMN
jgi:hypothetical protein